MLTVLAFILSLPSYLSSIQAVHPLGYGLICFSCFVVWTVFAVRVYRQIERG